MYENLKQWMLSSVQPAGTGQLSSLQTVCHLQTSARLVIQSAFASLRFYLGNYAFAFLQLVCGGIAGSTAALFTTPFDVVKTRLQTQVLNALHIWLLMKYTLEYSL